MWAGEVPGSPFRLVRGQCMVNTTEQELLATMTLPDDGAVNRTLRTIDETFSGGACRVAWGAAGHAWYKWVCVWAACS